MNDGPFKADIVQKTAAEWTAVNPLIPKGDLAIASDTGEMKAGDGKSWSATSAIPGTGGGASGTFYVKDGDDVLYEVFVQNGKIVSWELF